MSSSRNTPVLTSWFPPDVPPVRVGVYEVNDAECLFPEDKWYAYWDGNKFGWRDCTGPDAAFSARGNGTFLPERTVWRGLARKP
jgi:hypothetical protein